VLPALVLYSAFVVYPLLTALVYSLYDWRGTAQSGFSGLGNFTSLFTQFPLNQQLWGAFAHTMVFFLGTMLAQNTFGLLVAVLLFRSRRTGRFLRTVYTLPYLVSPVVVGYLWSLMLSPAFGPVNAALRAVGLDSLALPWLGDPSLALPIVILVNAWQYLGFPILLFGAALAGIPAEYSEAAMMDGAGPWKSFRHITLPLLLPAIGTVSILTFIGCFNVFGLVYALEGSQGSPGGATDVLGLLFYRVAFEQGGVNAIGQSSALAVVMFVVIFGTAVLANGYLRRKEAALR
jgi:raffinose/stachyose/melibiose transport system permease protein